MCYHTANCHDIIVAFLNCTIFDNRIIKKLIFWPTERLTRAYLARRECDVRTHIETNRNTEESISTAQLRYPFSQFNEVFSHIHYVLLSTFAMRLVAYRQHQSDRSNRKADKKKDLNMNYRIVARKRMQRIDLIDCSSVARLARSRKLRYACVAANQHLCVSIKHLSVCFFFIRTRQKYLFLP